MARRLPSYVIAAAALGTCICFADVPSARANLLLNGDFATGDFTDWSATGNVAVQSDLTRYGAGSASTYLANFGQGNGADDGVISQSFSTTPDTTYTVSFDYGAFGDSAHTQSILASVTSGTVTTTDPITSGAGSVDISSLVAESFTFVAGATTSTISFSDTSTYTNSIDGVLAGISVNETSTAVPEPASGALLLCSLIGGYVARRRKRIGR